MGRAASWAHTSYTAKGVVKRHCTDPLEVTVRTNTILPVLLWTLVWGAPGAGLWSEVSGKGGNRVDSRRLGGRQLKTRKPTPRGKGHRAGRWAAPAGAHSPLIGNAVFVCETGENASHAGEPHIPRQEEKLQREAPRPTLQIPQVGSVAEAAQGGDTARGALGSRGVQQLSPHRARPGLAAWSLMHSEFHAASALATQPTLTQPRASARESSSNPSHQGLPLPLRVMHVPPQASLTPESSAPGASRLFLPPPTSLLPAFAQCHLRDPSFHLNQQCHPLCVLLGPNSPTGAEAGVQQ